MAENNINKIIGKQLRFAREFKKMQINELAEKSGLSRVTIIEIEAGRNNPTLITLQRLANALDFSIDISFMPLH